MPGSHILKNTAATLEVTFSVGNADAGVTVTVTRADGTAIVTGAAATQSGGAGRYTYALAPQTELDALTATWTGTFGGTAQSVVTFAEIVGGYLFALTDLRNFGDKTLSNATTYPDADLRDARNRITDLFQDATQTSFVPRYYRETLDGTGTNRFWLRWKRASRLISLSIAGVALTGPELAFCHVYPTGRVERNAWWPWERQNIIVAYEYGWPAPPADVSRAALALARYDLVSNDLTDRMISFSNDLGQVRLSVPGQKYPTGLPLVDSVLARYDETDPMPPR